MADLNLSYAHGQPPEVARAHFETAVINAAKQFGFWIRSVEWDANRTSARLTGPGYNVLTRVDEEGTEAAAATAVVMMKSRAMAPGPPIPFRADHPFVVIIRERTTGSVLFLGRVNDPKPKS